MASSSSPRPPRAPEGQRQGWAPPYSPKWQAKKAEPPERRLFGRKKKS